MAVARKENHGLRSCHHHRRRNAAPRHNRNLNACTWPEAYLPHDGGYCAFGAAPGGKFDSDPTQFRVVDGKLYLNKNATITRRWQQDIDGNIRAADRQWPAIRDRAARELQ
jgi:hypothetical protein